ncbi:hypothetical protein BGZ46_008655 [Entomortierella lignicola]|nr:hypothetical protein BGZ46_008655 [Entomortierella lignicola]
MKRIVVWEPTWASNEGSNFLESINKAGVSATHDAVSVFWILNTKLPPSKRIAYLPTPAYKDNFCVISEKQLLETLLRRREDSELRKKLVKIFGTVTVAKDNSQCHPGELYRKLFFHGKKTNYDRLSCVATPADDSGQLFHGLIDLKGPSYKSDIQTLEVEAANSSQYKEAKETLKANIKNDIIQKLHNRKAKYVLTGTLHTDGHQLKVHAHSLVKRRTKSKNKEASDVSSIDIGTFPANPASTSSCATNTKMEYLPAMIPDEAALQTLFNGQDSFPVLAIDPGIKSTATAVVVDSLSPEKSWNLSLSKGSHNWNSQRYRKKLERLKKEQRYSRDGNLMSVNDLEARIQAISSPWEEDSLQQSFQSLKESYKAHTTSIFEVENDLRRFYGSKQLKVGRYHKDQGETSEVVRAIESMLRATRGTVDQNKSESEQKTLAKRKPIVAIGDGNFSCRNPNAIRSKKFISKLQTMGTGKGMLVCCVDEFRTSIFCCRCHSRMKTRGRSVICQDPACGGKRDQAYDLAHNLDSKCGLERDRDHNAGQNT